MRPSRPSETVARNPSGTPGGLDGWPSGLRRTPGERVGSNASWVRIPPRPYAGHPARITGRARPFDRALGPSQFEHRGRRDAPHPEGWQNGNAPVSKTGARKGLRVRIPPPPLSLAGFEPSEGQRASSPEAAPAAGGNPSPSASLAGFEPSERGERARRRPRERPEAIPPLPLEFPVVWTSPPVPRLPARQVRSESARRDCPGHGATAERRGRSADRGFAAARLRVCVRSEPRGHHHQVG